MVGCFCFKSTPPISLVSHASVDKQLRTVVFRPTASARTVRPTPSAPQRAPTAPPSQPSSQLRPPRRRLRPSRARAARILHGNRTLPVPAPARARAPWALSAHRRPLPAGECTHIPACTFSSLRRLSCLENPPGSQWCVKFCNPVCGCSGVGEPPPPPSPRLQKQK